MRSVAGKVVVVTGAGSGIGRALACEFARRGARVALSDRALEHLSDVREVRRQIVGMDAQAQADLARPVAPLQHLGVAIGKGQRAAGSFDDYLAGGLWTQRPGIARSE